MKLTSKERKALENFTHILRNKFGDQILEIIIFGSKARGNSQKSSDIDIMVIISNNDWRIVDQIRNIGYDLDENIDYRFSIQVVPESHVKYLKDHNFQFIRNVEKEGIVI